MKKNIIISILLLLVLLIFVIQTTNKPRIANNDSDFDCNYYNEDGSYVSIISTIDGDVYDTIMIQDKLLYSFPGQSKWYEVRNIEDGAFREFHKLKKLEIANTVKTIGNAAFYGCVNLGKVIYHGTKEEWEQIKIGNDNECLLNATIVFEK